MTDTGASTNPATPSGSEIAQSAEELDELRRQLAQTDPAVVVSNHCYGLFELAAVYLSEQPPRLIEAQVAIDALAGVVDALGERLGESAEPLAEGLAQLRLAWVQLRAVADA